ncbi:tape measure protein [Mycolicibacterium setense]
MATKLASGYIDLSVKYSSAMRQITSDLTGFERQARDAGARAGKANSSAFQVEAGKGGRAAAVQLADQFQAEGSRRASRVGSVVGKAIGGAMVGAAGLAVGGIATTLFKGFDRYKSLDATAKRLQAMGKSGDDVRSIMGDINSVVEGTPIALDAASKSATMFLQGGVKQGQELKSTLTAIADAAGSSGGDFSELAIIFSQVMNKGKLNAEEMLQLNERNIPIQKWLQTELGVTGEELTKMSKDGKISFQDLINAVESGAGGMAKKMGDTIDGALGNMQTAVARTGANFLAAIFGDPMSTTEGPGGMAQAINNVTEKINGLNNWVVAHKDEIKDFFNSAVGVAKDLGEKISNVSRFLKEHPGLIAGVVTAFVAWKAITGVASLISNLKTISTLLGVTLPNDAKTGASKINSALAIIAIPAIGQMLTEQIDEWLKNNHPDMYQANHSNTPGDLGKNARDWVDRNILGEGREVSTGVPQGPVPGGTSALPGILSGQGDPGMNPQRGGVTPPGFPAPKRPDGNSLNLPGVTGAGGITGGRPTPGSGLVAGGLTGSTVDQIAASFGLTKSSGTRQGDDGYHGSGQAGDYAGSPAAMQRFAAYMSQNYGSGLAEIIFDAKGWSGNVKNGKNTGAFGNVYTMDQAGYHGDHVHVAWAKFDQGGWWPSGTMGINTTGEDELVLNPEQQKRLAEQGIDPNTLTHGTGGANFKPGPVPGGAGAELPDMVRTEGYIPAAAGHSGKSGNSFLAGLYGMGAEVINGVIDQAASAASTAATMGANAVAPGSGGAAQAGISMGTQVAKRGVQYGAEILGIWTDALIEQATPFGAPRWISTDPTAFMPSSVMPAVTSSIEQAFLKTPEQVENPVPAGVGQGEGAQLDPTASAPNDYSVHLNGVTVTDVNQLTQQAKDQQNLQMMRHAGRP